MNRMSNFGSTFTVLFLCTYIADSVDNRRPSTAGSPEVCIGVMKKGPSVFMNGEDLGPGTRTIEYPGSVN